MTASDRRAAAKLRRQAAMMAGEQGGDVAYRQFRAAVPGAGPGRLVGTDSKVAKLRASKVRRNGKDMFRTEGFFTVYNRGYPMWDSFGEYEEQVGSRSGAKSLARDPDVAWLENHRGITMARTRNGTLILSELSEGGWHEGFLNAERDDVRRIVSAIDDGLVDEMSYAFTIPDGGGLWSEDWTTFQILEYDIDRGDVSAVNYGANPFTSITARTREVLDDLGRLPAGALAEARHRLSLRTPPRDRIVATQPIPPRAGLAPPLRRLYGKIDRNMERMLEVAAERGLTVADLPSMRLPWYEIRNADGMEPAADNREPGPESGVATIFIYDEIGGSFGVDAKTFAADLMGITAPTIKLRINSPGGAVHEAKAISSSLMHHPSRVVAYVDGVAASAATIIALGADEVVTMPGGQWFLHDASATDDGNAAEKAKMNTFLDRQSNDLAATYARRMGVTVEEARQLMLDETWAFDTESVELGLADRVATRAEFLPADDGEMAQRMKRSFDMTRYGWRYANRDAAPAPRIERTLSASEARANGREMLTHVRAHADGIGEAAADATELVRQAVRQALGDEPEPERSTTEQPMGRSIALIEAILATNEKL